ncbi:MAG TPA: hypothetical protein VG276_28760 [Actinomycetes bacterium]|nr:hypothetical protein [Actinomycetes bacterium]
MRTDEIIARVAAVVLRDPHGDVLGTLRRELSGDDLEFAETLAAVCVFIHEERQVAGFGPDGVARLRDHYEARRLAASVRR